MKFNYIASQPDGKVIQGQIEAKDVSGVLQFLSSRGLRPVSIKPVRESEVGGGISGGKITIADQIFISKYLSLMLKLGTGLLQAINILIEDFDKKAVRSFLMEVRDNLEGGRPFFSTFAKYPKIFSQVYINLVRAGEASGNLDSVFENLTNSLAKEKMLRDQVRSALIYPILLLSASVLILVFLVMYALPKIANVFEQGGFTPPLFSRIVFTVGLFFAHYGFFFIGLAVIALIAAFFAYKNSMGFRRVIFSIIHEIPVVRDLMNKSALQRFAATLSELIKAGIPLTDALEITAQTVGNVDLHDALLRISREGLAKGLTVGEAFRREPFFPKTVVNLMAISEKAGHIEEVLGTLSDFYSSEIDNSLKSLVSFLEPVMLMGIGIIVGLIALSIIVPIYQLTTQF
ncbi:type II secretion system F family protein [Patescibacteria group bacterium]|nr:type II secretion system F family protein [Patescibacteria group bacterium]MCL5114861.1 type II secretion system F family protein [Patescibacteria group bacterium]